jgi:hypothetical protein
LLEAGLSLSLAGLSMKTRFALYAWNLQRLFDEWQPTISRGRPLVVELDAPVHSRRRGEQDAIPVETRIRG